MRRWFFAALALACAVQGAWSQDLIVNGTMNNTGLIRVKNQTVIAQPTVGGTIELTGGDQPLPAKQYQTVRLTGTGTKTTTGGDLSILGNLTIASPVTLSITKGSVLTLGDTLFESGTLAGAIRKSVDLSGGAVASDFGNIGASVSWSGSAPGVTSVMRISDSTVAGNGNQSVKRLYIISPTVPDATGTVTLKFASAELNGNDPALLELWKSNDNGTTWLYQGGTVDTSAGSVTMANARLGGLWAASDTLHRLGPILQHGIPASATVASSPTLTSTILTQAGVCTVLITDAAGDPVSNVSVTFSISSSPATASGQSLSDTTVTTDSTGKASTTLTLGDKTGTYTVTAAAGSLTPTTFTATALHGASALLSLSAGNGQTQPILSAVDTSFTVTVLDVGGNPVDNAVVQFAVTSTPTGATGQSLSAGSVSTDSLGHASVNFTLGNKVGAYQVTATTASLPPIVFTANALHGAASALVYSAGNAQIKQILEAIDTSFTVVVTDAGGNPVSGIAVQFAVTGRPAGATGDSLTTLSAVTDSLGRASTVLTLGNKVGSYSVTATSPSLPSVVFTATAVNKAASSMLLASGNSQVKPILTALDTAFVVTLRDVGGNPVEGALVQFAVTGRPASASGDTLSAVTVFTDSLGRATSVLTLGSKVGTYTITATSASLPPVLFTVNAVHGAAASVARTTGNAQSKAINTTLDTAFTATVTDIGGNPVDNVTVNFTISAAPTGATGQSLSVASAVTDATGKASTILTLGDKIGTYKVDAVISGVADSLITFNATALSGQAASASIALGNGQSAVNGQVLSDPFVVLVVDAGGNPVQGESVRFGIASAPSGSAGQSLSDTLVATDNTGRAATIFTLGNRTGTYVIQASSSSLGGALIFRATAVAGAASAMNTAAGNAQSSPIATTLPAALTVKVFDVNGNPVPGTTVRFALTSQPAGAAGASLGADSVTTDSTGAAAVTLTLGSKVGTYQVTASAAGIPDAVFTSTAMPGAAVAMTQLSGSDQSGSILTDLSAEFAVHLVDVGANSTPGVPVRFTIVSVPTGASSYRLTDTLVTTDSAGGASTTLHLGDKTGIYIVSAHADGVADANFSAVAVAGAAVAMQAVSGTGQSDSILSTLQPFIIRVADIGGNGVPSSSVRFALTAVPAGSIGTVLSDTAGVSDSSGAASATLTLGSKVGTYEVTAFMPVSPRSESQAHKSQRSFASAGREVAAVFRVQATHGAAASLQQALGDRQIAPTASQLDTGFIVRVRDIGGNAVPNLPVTYSISSAPPKAAGQRLNDTLVTTDSLGVAATLLTLGDRMGSYTVTAEVPSLPPTFFTADGYYIYGDPNNDIDVNIADITTLIDYVTNRSAYSEVDSIKTDLNRDGRLDTADVGVLRDSILAEPLTFDSVRVPVVTAKMSGGSAAVGSPEADRFSGAVAQLEMTRQGLRLNLSNTVPVNGIELRLRLKDSVAIAKVNYVFSRADNMDAVVLSHGREVTVLAYSLLNAEIQPGDGSILRLPSITSLDQIDTSKIILATMDNVAVTPTVTLSVAPPEKYPTTFTLAQNYPNPFNGGTVIEYNVPDLRTTETKVVIQIFNMLGQKVKTLVYGPHDPGHYSVTWDGTNQTGERVATGVYFYRMLAKNLAITKKMLYVK